MKSPRKCGDFFCFVIILFVSLIVIINQLNNIKCMSIFRKKDRNAVTKVTYNGIGFSGLLAIAFIVLKLCNVISWSWWWVLAPIWIPTVFGILILIIIFGLYVWLS